MAYMDMSYIVVILYLKGERIHLLEASKPFPQTKHIQQTTINHSRHEIITLKTIFKEKAIHLS